MKAKPRKKIKGGKVKSPYLAFIDSEPYTLSGGLMKIYIPRCLAVKKGESEKIKVKILELDGFRQGQKFVDENSGNDLIAEFTGILENSGKGLVDGTCFFRDMKPVKEINWKDTPPYPWFNVVFTSSPDDKPNNNPQINSSVPIFPVVIGKNDEPYDDGKYEIGFMIEKEDGTFIGGTSNEVSFFYGEHSYRPFLDLFDIRTQLDSINLLNMTASQIDTVQDEKILPDVEPMVSSTTKVYASTITAYNEKKMKGIDAALKKIDKLIKSSKNPYFQNIQAVNDYYSMLDDYKGRIKEYEEISQKKNIYSDEDTLRFERVIIRPLVDRLSDLEDTIYKYLKPTGKPPKAYLDKIDKNIAIIQRNKNIDKILNNPAVQIMGLLPGAGVVTGTLKLIKGDIFDGFLDVFGSVVTYGSFLKLSRVARAYKNTSKSTTELLYSYRYRKLVSTITTPNVLDKITETSLKHSGTFLGNLMDTVGTFRSLKGHVDSLSILHRNSKYIKLMTERGIKGISVGAITDSRSFVRFLDDLENINATAEFFAHLRILHATVKGTKDAYSVMNEAMSDVDKLLRYKEIPGVSEFDSGMTGEVRQLFKLMDGNGFKINEILNATTKEFPSNSAIVDHFNKDLEKYDMFHVNMNADVRYKNSRNEMLLAVNDIIDMWRVQKSDMDAYYEEIGARLLNHSVSFKKINWAVEKKYRTKELDSSLETRVENFSNKIKAQIELREGLVQYNGDLACLESAVDWVTAKMRYTNGVFSSEPFSSGAVIYDIDIENFREHAERLIKKYY